MIDQPGRDNPRDIGIASVSVFAALIVIAIGVLITAMLAFSRHQPVATGDKSGTNAPAANRPINPSGISQPNNPARKEGATTGANAQNNKSDKDKQKAADAEKSDE